MVIDYHLVSNEMQTSLRFDFKIGTIGTVDIHMRWMRGRKFQCVTCSENTFEAFSCALIERS